jgi:tetratricopeptide (TPR) repeat protein
MKLDSYPLLGRPLAFVTPLVLLAVTTAIATTGHAGALTKPTAGDSGFEISAATDGRPQSMESLVRAGFEHNYVGDYEAANRVWDALASLYPYHPAAAVHRIDTLYWLLSYDEASTLHDVEIIAHGERALTESDALIEQMPNSADAHFYRGQALIHLARMDVMRGRYMSAGTYGEKGRVSLERALEIDPTLTEVKYPLGIYYFYAARLPGIARMMSWLWFVPKGDGQTGLRYLEEAARDGGLFATASELTLAGIYFDFEDEPQKTLAIVNAFTAHYPRNVLFSFYATSVLYEMGEFDRSVEYALLPESRTDLAPHEHTIQNMTRVWRARSELERGSAERAMEILASVPHPETTLPVWGPSWLYVARGNVLDVMGKRQGALAEYQSTLALEPDTQSPSAVSRAEQGIDEIYHRGLYERKSGALRAD